MTFRDIISKALTKQGKQENLATALDLSPSSLSKKLSGETFWSEREIDRLLEITTCEIVERGRVHSLMMTLKTVLDEMEILERIK